MLRWRLPLGILFAAVVLGLCWLDHHASLPGTWLIPLAGLIVLLCTSEMLRLAAAVDLALPHWLLSLGNLALLLSAWLPWLAGGRAEAGVANAAAWPLAGLTLCVTALFVREMACYEQPGQVIRRLAGGTFVLVYVGLMASFLVQLRLIWGTGALVSLLVVVKMGDIGAYTVGRIFGRHKMAPKLSPGKTWEGFAGALAFACLGAWLTFAWLVPALSSASTGPQRPLGWLVFGLVIGVWGVLGDLAESLMKRDAGLKDSGPWLPGFGGVLDLLDSILLAAPAAWLCWMTGLVA